MNSGRPAAHWRPAGAILRNQCHVYAVVTSHRGRFLQHCRHCDAQTLAAGGAFFLLSASTVWAGPAEVTEDDLRNRALIAIQSEEKIASLRDVFFAWCTGKGVPKPGTNLEDRDPSCAAAASSHSHLIARSLELAIIHRATQGSLGLNLMFHLPGAACQSLNDLRYHKHTESGQCLTYDERMEGSELDLIGLGGELDATKFAKNMRLQNTQTDVARQDIARPY